MEGPIAEVGCESLDGMTWFWTFCEKDRYDMLLYHWIPSRVGVTEVSDFGWRVGATAAKVPYPESMVK